MIAVIVPAHNEERLLGACMHRLRVAASHAALAGEEVEVVIALDRCSDASEPIARAAGVHTVRVDAGNVGVARATATTHALALGARWIASTDADSLVPHDWLAGQLRRGCDAFCGIVTVEDWLDYDAATIAAFAGPAPPADGHRHIHGANFGISADAYRRCGGFAPLACSEDVAIVRALEAIDARIDWSATPRVITSARRDARACGGFGDYLKALEDLVHGRKPMAGHVLPVLA